MAWPIAPPRSALPGVIRHALSIIWNLGSCWKAPAAPVVSAATITTGASSRGRIRLRGGVVISWKMYKWQDSYNLSILILLSRYSHHYRIDSEAQRLVVCT